jgi:hypothetical protein
VGPAWDDELIARNNICVRPIVTRGGLTIENFEQANGGRIIEKSLIHSEEECVCRNICGCPLLMTRLNCYGTFVQDSQWDPVAHLIQSCDWGKQEGRGLFGTESQHFGVAISIRREMLACTVRRHPLLRHPDSLSQEGQNKHPRVRVTRNPAACAQVGALQPSSIERPTPRNCAPRVSRRDCVWSHD